MRFRVHEHLQGNDFRCAGPFKKYIHEGLFAILCRLLRPRTRVYELVYIYRHTPNLVDEVRRALRALRLWPSDALKPLGGKKCDDPRGSPPLRVLSGGQTPLLQPSARIGRIGASAPALLYLVGAHLTDFKICARFR